MPAQQVDSSQGTVQVYWFYPGVRDPEKPAVRLLLAYHPLGKKGLHHEFNQLKQ